MFNVINVDDGTIYREKLPDFERALWFARNLADWEIHRMTHERNGVCIEYGTFARALARKRDSHSETDPENIYGRASIRQSIEEDRK
jgi:hypothetical protein